MEIILGAAVAGLFSLVTALINRRGNRKTLGELQPNGGGSMRDLLDQVAARQIRQGSQLCRLEEKVDQHIGEHS